MSRSAPESVRPKAGDPCTVCIGSDRYAADVVAVTPASVTVSYRDEHLRRWGQMRFHWGRGRFRNNSRYLRLGVAEDYRDPCF